MATIPFKNPFGAANSGVDQQRGDLFYVTLQFPLLLRGVGGTNLWDEQCGFTVARWPFPDRSVTAIPVKYLQKTNHQIGGNEAVGPVEMQVRYAFNRRTAELLERWFYMVSNRATGGVGLTSAVKTNGTFTWLIPNMEKAANPDDTSEARVLVPGGAYRIEGCWPRNLKPSDANQEANNELVMLTFSLQIDDYYPVRVADLDPTAFANANNRGLFSNGVQAATTQLG